jgi:hypothetical protein
MGIKKIKKENDDLSISVIDSLGLFDISSTKKYTQFLIKMLILLAPLLAPQNRTNTSEQHSLSEHQTALICPISRCNA